MEIRKHTKGMLALLACTLLIATACQRETVSSSSQSATETSPHVILKGKLSIPLPDSYQTIRPDNSIIIVTREDSNIGYRTIDRKELEFIGSKKKPYEFFTSAFKKPEDQVETAFIEGLGSIKNTTLENANNLEFYLLYLTNSEKVYITSPDLEFAVEVTTKSNPKAYLKQIIEKTHIAE